MKLMRMTCLAIAAVASMGAGGCEGGDGRLAGYARNRVDQQTRQNDQFAKQNTEVTQQNRQVAAARKLVGADAPARQEMVIARKALPEGEHIEQMTLDQQRESLEADRQQLARERYWELLIAAAIGGCGVLLACLVPLVICLYVLRSLQFDSGAEAVLNELLISELTAGRTQRVLPTTERRPALDQETMPTDPAGAEDMGTDPFPF